MTASSTVSEWRRVGSCDLCGETSFTLYSTRPVDGRRLDRCNSCDLVFLNPRPGEVEIESWYEDGYFTAETGIGLGSDHLAMAKAGMRHGTESFRQLAIRRRLRGLRILEVGCGGGAFISQCAEAGAIVTGLEISAFAADRLRALYGFDVRVGTVQSSTFPDESFDVVAFTDVIEHVVSPADFLSGLRRLLRPGGVAYGVLPNLDCVAHYGPQWAGFRYHAEHLYYLGNLQLQFYLKNAELRAKEIWTYGEPWEPDENRSAGDKPSVTSHPLRKLLREVPGLLLVVRGLRSALATVKREVRARRARYREGLGHDLYFLAERT